MQIYIFDSILSLGCTDVLFRRLIPAHGMDDLREAYLPVKLSDCPICLESFSHGVGMVGADGLPAVVLDCGHVFCQR